MSGHGVGSGLVCGWLAAARPARAGLAASRVSSAWLGLREAADAAARAAGLVALVRRRLAGAEPVVIHDLRCGTGSMGRWLAPRLSGRQHWIMHDRDPELLERAAATMVNRAADGAPVTVEIRRDDLTRLGTDDLAEASLITGSAVLDMLTAAELERTVAACAGAGCPTLLTISFVGRVELTPADPLDAEIVAAFNAHQRRTTGGRRLLGPDAVDATVAAFSRRGVATSVQPSPWRLDSRNGDGDGDLISEWFLGWLAAACEQRPELVGAVPAYATRRLRDAQAGRLAVTVHHSDVLAGCE